MSTTTLDLTAEELTVLVKNIVDERIIELIGDPEDGLEVSDELKERLLDQRKQADSGDYGIPLEEVFKRLELD